MEYGAFVKIPGFRKQGLVHRTHMSSCRVENPSEVVEVGERVWVKVIGREVQDEKVKLSFSMKAVNQGTGKDLDPNNVALEQDERRKREFRDFSRQRITLEAVLNTTCKKCGCKGHFAKDCFSQPGGVQYGLLPDEEEEEEKGREGLMEQPSQSEKTEPAKRKKVSDY
ncbi:NO40 protein, partial [Amia calva]|nr:NO40 protein [Amia calva]